MKLQKIIKLIHIVGIFTLSAIFPVFAGQETIYVNCEVLRCRASAEIRPDNIVARLYYGECFQKVGEKDGWTEILYKGKNCYVASEYVTQTAIPMNDHEIGLFSEWKYADYSAIHTGKAVLYQSTQKERKNKIICVNAGHGTKGGSSVKTLSHPDGTEKVTGGTTGAGAVKSTAVSGGMTFLDGTPEHKVTLSMALILKEKLLSEGYDVLMIRETEDVQLDNIARTVIANNKRIVILHFIGILQPMTKVLSI